MKAYITQHCPKCKTYIVSKLEHQDVIPATAFINNSADKQWDKILSENEEELEARSEYLWYSRHAIAPEMQRRAYAMELIDGQMARETELARLGYSYEERHQLRREVVEKNRVRGYYNDAES